MDEHKRDTRLEILERIFPDLRYGGDPDVERYFELRASGRMLDALSVYRSRLRPRYPDDQKRIILLSLYRQRSPSYSIFLKELLMERADDIIARIRRNIDAMAKPLERVAMKDTYAVLKAVEEVARLLPDDSDAAKAHVDAYEEYAKILDYRRGDMASVSYLLSEFYKQTLSDEDEAPDFVASSLAAEEEKRKREQRAEERNFFDLSRIEFDAADVARIEIPVGLERDEDKTLAYCHKYWLRVDDPAFERIVWLYSRKYGTRHYDVFKAIKTGRRRKYADDEILSRVATTIADRYSYTVQGDLYMQAAWRRIKAGMYGSASARQKSLQARQAETQAVEKKRSTSQKRPADTKAMKPASSEKTVLMPAKRRSALVLERQNVRISKAAEESRGSISDRIKTLSGRAYDVYRDIFFSKVRPHIRQALAEGSRTSGGERLNQAEDTVYEFMERNYFNAYMDWTGSLERNSLAELGFNLEALDAIIEACYKKISA
ncbi:MAG TPA: hypothetical protein PLC54_00805 [Spirochaetales bacterium]|nr:hypothetical protein [Spirochaetales bacterium]